ncbi:MAG: hypothetical protein OEM51_02095, partial [Gammaproteobacteria bacterium]|nr:hypothetical protein [Gammaproteobacteria bacterium]
MRRNRAITNGWARFAAVIAAVAISACSTLPPEPEPVEEQPEIVVEPPVAIAEPRPPVKLIKPPQPRQLPPVAIVLTNNQPAYAEVAQELIRHLVDFDIYDLHENGAPPVSILRAINDSDASAVVAIGLRA